MLLGSQLRVISLERRRLFLTSAADESDGEKKQVLTSMRIWAWCQREDDKPRVMIRSVHMGAVRGQ